MKSSRYTHIALTLGLALATLAQPLRADDKADGVEKSLLKAKQRLSDKTYVLEYKFQPGEQIRFKVTHLVTIETKISDTRETAKTRSVSTKLWKIDSVDKDGNIVLAHIIEDVDMWQQLSDRDEIRYNSQKDDVPPLVYKRVAETLGKPIASITINKWGQIINRANATEQFNPSVGELTVPLPRQAIKVGQSWHLTDQVRVPLETQQFKTVRLRLKYKLEAVDDNGIATITMETQVLTPLSNPSLESKLVQKMKQGKILFDINKGRVVSSRLDLDRTVVNFSGANSIMQYLARFTEEAISADAKGETETATKSESDAEAPRTAQKPEK